MTSKQNNKDYIVGMYVRLSRDDERTGESLSIENQKAILNEYIEKQGFTLYDIYVDDGISGTTFDRPGVKRLLDDAKQGVINTVLVKDMSRFGRNYIMVGQHLDYVFPAFGIRFIALSDNIDTENKDTAAMDMMPIANVFNEWWAAATSKKLRAVRIQNAKKGKNGMSHAPYGKHTKRGYMHPLSGLLYCADCGAKMRLGWNMPKDIPYFNFNCGTRSRCGSSACFSHFITAPVLEKIVLNDVRDKAQKIVADEREFRRKYLEHTARLADKNQADVKRELKRTERRVAELDKLISAAFEEKVAGKIPEKVCLQLIDKYTAEQTELKERIYYLTQGLEEKQRAVTDVDEFIRRMKKHINAPELTRELCLELFEKLVIGGKETVTGKPQEVHIYYKIDIDSIL